MIERGCTIIRGKGIAEFKSSEGVAACLDCVLDICILENRSGYSKKTLTRAEVKALQAKGMSVREIAATLGKSERVIRIRLK